MSPAPLLSPTPRSHAREDENSRGLQHRVRRLRYYARDAYVVDSELKSPHCYRRASVNSFPRTISTPFTRTQSIPSASA